MSDKSTLEITTLIAKSWKADVKNMPDLAFEYGLIVHGYMSALVHIKAMIPEAYKFYMSYLPAWVKSKIFALFVEENEHVKVQADPQDPTASSRSYRVPTSIPCQGHAE